ncbi:MAG: hypothetical protein HY692_02295 [Cyanobacteria bacterium NC_groundwater_1444_Ag_S-0.65um_54_12]|nr:hypothetical protein [Cyanobacteria bacterium NC_groundwater_1444_Ag_S-0.65um_54_12]
MLAELALLSTSPPPAVHALPFTKKPAAAAEPTKTELTRLEELVIEALGSEYDGLQHSYLLKGQVRVILRELLVTCNEATIFLPPSEDRVERILFVGDVLVTRGKNTFRGERVTYHVANKRLVAEGSTRTHLFLPRSGNDSLERNLGIRNQP